MIGGGVRLICAGKPGLVSVEVNSGHPSDASSSGVPYVTNARRKWLTMPVLSTAI